MDGSEQTGILRWLLILVQLALGSHKRSFRGMFQKSEILSKNELQGRGGLGEEITSGFLGTPESCIMLMVPSFGYEGELPRSKQADQKCVYFLFEFIGASNLLW